MPRCCAKAVDPAARALSRHARTPRGCCGTTSASLRLGDLLDAPWPEVDEAALVQDEIELVLQVNGKLRGKLVVPAKADKAAIERRALAQPRVRPVRRRQAGEEGGHRAGPPGQCGRLRTANRCPIAAPQRLSSLAPALGGCGFQLRGATELPFSRIALEGFAPRSPLAEELQRTLAQSAEVVTNPAQAQVVLHALNDKRERSVVASTTAGQVRELQLRVRLEFRLATPAGRELIPATELLLTRDMSYSETAALAKEYEERSCCATMQTDIVAQLMRRLAA